MDDRNYKYLSADITVFYGCTNSKIQADTDEVKIYCQVMANNHISI